MSNHGKFLLLAGLAAVLGTAPAGAQLAGDLWDFDETVVGGFSPGPERDDIVPGAFIVDPPTLENLGFRWYVEGDANRNAAVEVAYRRAGGEAWREAQPMLRVRHEVVNRYRLVRPENPNPAQRDISYYYRTGNLFAGSVMFLEPGIEYEVRFTMRDPDGGAPVEPKVVSVATREEPPAWPGERTLHVYPEGFPGERASENVYPDIGAACAAAAPGDVVFLHAGVHRAAGAPWLLTVSGEAGRPIVIRGAGAAETVVEGPDLRTDLFRIPGSAHLMFEDLTLRRAHTAIHTARERAGNNQPSDRGGPGAAWLTVRRCRIEEVINGISTSSENSRNWFIADNVVTGTDAAWYPRATPERGYMDGSHTGVSVYGRGHVVCHNRISRFSDALTIAGYPHRSPADVLSFAVNIDFYNNDLSFAADDTLEADSGCHNIRVYRNLCRNTHTALSAQPVYGGPVYFVRNEAYGITFLSYKWNNHPAGVIAWHNTTVTGGSAFSTPPWSNGHLRNNLILGGGAMISAGTLTPETSTMDFNGYRGAGVRWMHGRLDGPDASRDRWGRVSYGTLADFTAATGYEKNGLEVDYDVFVAVSPVEQGRTYASDDFDFTLRPDGLAVDAGVRLPGVNDDFTGAAPDLGARELGCPRPVFGPR